ncbi:L-threonylcarbamoyladenylate synthase [Paenibacillus sp. 481]|uniref:L-threonylcarbamoyladenylate synthase n=1 Tax=Paenibacillus sp. 481 TaxID=2835869 RepID=UPI001E510E8F|nr:L-threonylcarbamoyladenylate synthase [Paenibacillus sp. 481]UHA75648.1 threonylcarbamoyl-AMP synthase [Paenibacillus sp. 481]
MNEQNEQHTQHGQAAHVRSEQLGLKKGEASTTRWWHIADASNVSNAPTTPTISTTEQGAMLREAAAMLAAGQTVAFPTETVYGLGADARNTAAVERIFAAKGRPSDNPLIVHIAEQAQLDALVMPYGDTARRLMKRFWPGPLTIVLPVRPDSLSPRVTAGLDTVGVRMPAHEIALALIAAAGCPVAAPSANRSGRPSPTKAEHVRDDLDGLIGGIVDGGTTGVGLESTVVELIGDRVHVLRPGGITVDMLREVVAVVTVDPAVDPAGDMVRGSEWASGTQADHGNDAAPRSPGMKYAHYAPKGTMQLVQGRDTDQVSTWIQHALDEAKHRGETTGVLAFNETVSRYQADSVVSLGSLAHLEEAAQRLYDALRSFDEAGASVIYAEACPSEGIGMAVMNRLVKAAGHRVIQL